MRKNFLLGSFLLLASSSPALAAGAAETQLSGTISGKNIRLAYAFFQASTSTPAGLTLAFSDIDICQGLPNEGVDFTIVQLALSERDEAGRPVEPMAGNYPLAASEVDQPGEPSRSAWGLLASGPLGDGGEHRLIYSAYGSVTLENRDSKIAIGTLQLKNNAYEVSGPFTASFCPSLE